MQKICAVLALAVVAAAWPAYSQSTETPTRTNADRGPFQLFGHTKAVWLLVRNGATGYKLAVKGLDKPWECVGAGKSGNVAAAAAVGEDLVVFFESGGHRRYSPKQADGYPGIEAPLDLWLEGTKVLAACAAADKTDAVLVLVVRPVHLKPRPTRPATGRIPPSREWVLLRYAEQKWEQVAVVPAEFAQPPVRAHLAAHKKTIYILAEHPEPALMAIEEGKLRNIALPVLRTSKGPAELVQPQPLAMTVINDALVLATFDSGSGGVSIARFASGQWKPVQQVRRDGKAVTWPGDNPPAVGRVGPKMAFAWAENDKWLFATCELDGQLAPADPLDAFAKAGRQELVARVQNLFFWGVFGVIVVLMFWPGQPLRTAPFSLPPTTFPAKLSKRLAAACIDILPFLIIAAPFLPWGKLTWNPPPSTEQIMAFFSCPEFLYASLAFMVIYPAYCFVMEYRWAATVGKMVMRLRVVADGGRPPALREVALRNVSKIIELMGLPLVFPLLFPILTRYRQRLGDKISWTAVIDTDLSLPPALPPDLEKEEDSSADEGKGNGNERGS